MNVYKLNLSCIPSTSWGINLENLLTRKIWGNLRQVYSDRQGGQCMYCGDIHQLSLHEEWSFNDKDLIQQLTGLAMLCKLCHGLKHIGRQAFLSDTQLSEAEQHFIKVNKCTPREYSLCRTTALEIATLREDSLWHIDWGMYRHLLRMANLKKQYQQGLYELFLSNLDKLTLTNEQLELEEELYNVGEVYIKSSEINLGIWEDTREEQIHLGKLKRKWANLAYKVSFLPPASFSDITDYIVKYKINIEGRLR